MSGSRRSAPRIHEFIVRLSDVYPSVWRRLRLSSGATLTRAARVIAVTMGWPASRPFAFTADTLRVEGQGRGGAGRRDFAELRLRQLFPDAGAEAEFEYGESGPWHLVIRLDRFLPPDEETRTPFCVAGGGVAPPIDIGGPWAWEERFGSASGHAGREPAWDDELGARNGNTRRVAPRFNPDVVNAELERIR